MSTPVLLRFALAAVLILSGTACTAPPASRTGRDPAAAASFPGSLDAELARLGLSGAVVIETLDASRRWTGASRGAPGLGDPSVPASTFKILNTLIALETGVAAPDTFFPWDGQTRFVPAWNQDLTFREAFRVSAVPVYQEVARRVGHQRMRAWVGRAGYGNADIGGPGEIDRFWLTGPLEITPDGQIAFLRRLLSGHLPFSDRSIATLREFMRIDAGDGWALHAKTGWANELDPPLGWCVGFVEKNGGGADGTFLFALRVEMPDVADAPKRQELAIACLRRVGVIPPSEE